ncbi:hypothetical protein SISSUDRAFT_1007743 [Sistotremastrum suecicum HHB10207 ss-3]|uniref:Uncharacterized protein n=1 Tax=Sistotremastrum suecicum HHB10207 ss-3 TaxID=1314776 RepID=A0A166BCK6_9AGAM|nr:hypothetical protein SISSUDRAFT_1007743 [Sistotremastrum suecicum HHB10207 ss-3]
MNASLPPRLRTTSKTSREFLPLRHQTLNRAHPRPANPKRQRPNWFSPYHLEKSSLSLCKAFGKHSGNPLWILANRLSRVKRTLALSRALNEAGLSAESFEKWKDIVHQPSLSATWQVLTARGLMASPQEIRLPTILPTQITSNTLSMLEHGESVLSRKPIPPWFFIHILCTKVTSLEDARLVVPFVLPSIFTLPAEFRAPILIMSANMISSWNLVPHVGNVISTLFQLPELVLDGALHFNLLLQTLSRFPSSDQITKYIVQVIQTMNERQFRLDKDSYRRLLNSPSLTIELAKTLRERMVREGFRPSEKHLELFLRFFALRGYSATAAGFLRAIRDERSMLPGIVPLDPNPSSHDISSRTRFDITYSKSLITNPTAAKEYLYRDPRWNASSQFSRRLLMLRDRQVRRPGTGSAKTAFVGSRSSPDLLKEEDELAATLNMHIKDVRIRTEVLVKAFRTAQQKFPPSRRLYAMIVKALLQRNKPLEANGIWDEFRKSGLPMDALMLRLGIQGHVAARKSAEALWFMQRYTRSPGRGRERSVHDRGKIKLEAYFFNAFMKSLFHIGRPDIVWALWDSMTSVFGVPPNDMTLTFVLRSAQSMRHHSRTSIRKALWDELTPETAVTRGQEPTADEAHKNLMEHLLDDGRGISDDWRGVPMWRRATSIFRRIILENWPQLASWDDYARMGRVEVLTDKLQDWMSPGTRESRAPLHAGPMQGNAIHGSGTPRWQIIPSDRSFCEYIRLLTIHGVAKDIPRTLNWMRALGVTPGRKTLAMSIVAFTELDYGSRVMEDWRAEYERTRFLDWIEKWVGKDSVPSERDLFHMRRLLYDEAHS